MENSKTIQKSHDGDAKHKNVKNFTRRLIAFHKSQNLFTSKLSWKIISNVFLTILLVQVFTFVMTKNNFKASLLSGLESKARASLVPLIDPSQSNYFASPITRKDALKITSTTNIIGLSVYNSDYNFLAAYGEDVNIAVTDYTHLQDSFYHQGIYEVVLSPEKLGFQYVIVVRMDAQHLQEEIRTFVFQSIIIMLMLSGLVTSVLMITLGFSLLEPLLFLQRTLLRAQANPEMPDLDTSPYDSKDEIGSAIDAAQTLIYQNSKNLQRIKTSAENQINKLAYFDTLTGLPNRVQFIKTVEEKIETNDPKTSSKFVIIAIDLDHFKDINDSMGHKVGDEILKLIGKRLSSALPESALVARNGEDEFAVYTKLTDGGPNAKDIASRLVAAIRDEPFKIYDEDFQVRVSVGYAIYPDHATDPDLVLKNADIALNRAKEEGRDTIRSYTKDFDKAVQDRFQMLRDLRIALEEDQLLLNFQPQFDLQNGSLIGCEALLRWWKPDNSKEGGRNISPVEFIPIAESSGLIVPIGEWVLRTACQTAAKLHKAGHEDIRMAVNVSGVQFMQDDFIDIVDTVLKETGIKPSLLELEVTESVFMDDINHTIDILQRLNQLGVELAIDDFGTGYSSLSYLRQFPIDRLKIDQSFIRNALNNSDDAAITRTIIALGHSLNLKVIAEGVETKDHEDFLLKEGCDEVQGYRYSKPITEKDFTAFTKNYGGDFSLFDETART